MKVELPEGDWEELRITDVSGLRLPEDIIIKRGEELHVTVVPASPDIHGGTMKPTDAAGGEVTKEGK